MLVVLSLFVQELSQAVREPWPMLAGYLMWPGIGLRIVACVFVWRGLNRLIPDAES